MVTTTVLWLCTYVAVLWRFCLCVLGFREKNQLTAPRNYQSSPCRYEKKKQGNPAVRPGVCVSLLFPSSLRGLRDVLRACVARCVALLASAFTNVTTTTKRAYIRTSCACRSTC